MRPPGKRLSAEQVERKRLAMEAAEIVANIRNAMERAKGNKARASSGNKLRYFLSFLVALWLLDYVPKYYDLLVTPLIEADFSARAIREFVAWMVLFAGFFFLAFFYKKVRVNHLPSARKALVDVLLCIGGLALLSTFFLVTLAYDIAAVLVIGIAVIMLWFARRCAKGNSRR